MNFKQASHKVLDLCIELQEQGKFINPDFNLKHKEIGLTYYDDYVNELPFAEAERYFNQFTENPSYKELFDGDYQGNFETCIQFLQGLLEPVNEFKGMDLNEINYTIKERN